MHTIYVIVERGIVQDVRGVPAGVNVSVRDFDTAGSPASELDGDEEGKGYREALYQGRATVTPILRRTRAALKSFLVSAAAALALLGAPGSEAQTPKPPVVARIKLVWTQMEPSLIPRACNDLPSVYRFGPLTRGCAINLSNGELHIITPIVRSERDLITVGHELCHFFGLFHNAEGEWKTPEPCK